MKRVVITGMGLISPLGNDINTFWNNLKEGKGSTAKITKFDASQFRTQIACEVKGFAPETFLDKAEIKRTDLFTQYALAAAQQALNDSKLDIASMDPFDIGVI